MELHFFNAQKNMWTHDIIFIHFTGEWTIITVNMTFQQLGKPPTDKIFEKLNI